ncbi:cytochrome c oxidase subunit 4 [Gulosibacter hominis]|uniref:aa3-type cytochrome oxidase subunit IV n=1 Tax=Gulosibacter hominis TaxID=2770504 RepID=UPI001919BC36|nr:cytochrome c oxidase subunit 4 [Gulosibacter hominis]
MRTNAKLLWALSVFYALVAIAYIAWTWIDAGQPEPVGSVAFVLMIAFSMFIAFYLDIEDKPFRKKRLPEDREEAEIHEADPELGFFAPHSMWPFVTAAGIGFVFASIAFGWWPAFFLAPIAIIGVIGWSYEFYRGHYGH